jgi:hypothetical protein
LGSAVGSAVAVAHRERESVERVAERERAFFIIPISLLIIVHFSGNGKGKGSCCGVVFMTFLKFFLKCREAASNALSVQNICYTYPISLHSFIYILGDFLK